MSSTGSASNPFHFKGGDIKIKVKYKGEEMIAILCEQYDCHVIIEPWLESWLMDESKTLHDLGQEEWIYIDWAFGREKFFRERAELLVRRLEFHSDGTPVVLHHKKFPEVMLDKFSERVMAVREATIQKLLNMVYAEVDRYMCGKTTVCKCSTDQKACDAASYGGLLLEVGRTYLWPRISAKDYKKTIVSLRRTIAGLGWSRTIVLEEVSSLRITAIVELLQH
ncbi:hypothetical protein DL98DRAFT_591494 [Cadophora sp. DSE1049]|nr:hypothetical protein DL98DRAFT_591494 [Cadophora sp. DSE1049]